MKHFRVTVRKTYSYNGEKAATVLGTVKTLANSAAEANEKVHESIQKKWLLSTSPMIHWRATVIGADYADGSLNVETKYPPTEVK